MTETFKVGDEVTIGPLPDHTPHERRVLDGLSGVITSDDAPFWTVNLPFDTDELVIKNNHLFRSDELSKN